MAVSKSALRTIYHKTGGAVQVYEIDARHALSHVWNRGKPKDEQEIEWSETPWKDDGEPSAEVVDIPSEWQDLRPIERINLAARIGADRRGLTAAKADDVIQREIDRRESGGKEIVSVE